MGNVSAFIFPLSSKPFFSLLRPCQFGASALSQVSELNVIILYTQMGAVCFSESRPPRGSALLMAGACGLRCKMQTMQILRGKLKSPVLQIFSLHFLHNSAVLFKRESYRFGEY